MGTSEETGAHTYFAVPLQGMESNESCYEWGVDVVNSNCLLVVISTEKLEKA